MKTVLVLIKKDIYDAFTEKTAALMLLTSPAVLIGMGLLLGDDELLSVNEFVFLMSVLFSAALVPICVFPLLIGEEKEKRTLPVLLRAGVSERKFLASKAFAALILLLLEEMFLFFIRKIDVVYLPVFLICCVLTALCVLPIGGVIGLLGVDKNSVNVYATAPTLVMMIAPVFTLTGFKELYPLSGFFPTAMLTEVFFRILRGEEMRLGILISAFLITLFWGAFGCGIFYGIYRKIGLRTKALEMK